MACHVHDVPLRAVRTVASLAHHGTREGSDVIAFKKSDLLTRASIIRVKPSSYALDAETITAAAHAQTNQCTFSNYILFAFSSNAPIVRRQSHAYQFPPPSSSSLSSNIISHYPSSSSCSSTYPLFFCLLVWKSLIWKVTAGFKSSS
jgi:hypothetical protein